MTNSEIIAEEGERENEKMGRREAHYSLPSLAGGTQGGKNLAPLRYFILSRVYNSLLLQRFDFLCERFNLSFE